MARPKWDYTGPTNVGEPVKSAWPKHETHLDDLYDNQITPQEAGIVEGKDVSDAIAAENTRRMNLLLDGQDPNAGESDYNGRDYVPHNIYFRPGVYRFTDTLEVRHPDIRMFGPGVIWGDVKDPEATQQGSGSGKVIEIRNTAKRFKMQGLTVTGVAVEFNGQAVDPATGAINLDYAGNGLVSKLLATGDVVNYYPHDSEPLYRYGGPDPRDVTQDLERQKNDFYDYYVRVSGSTLTLHKSQAGAIGNTDPADFFGSVDSNMHSLTMARTCIECEGLRGVARPEEVILEQLEVYDSNQYGISAKGDRVAIKSCKVARHGQDCIKVWFAKNGWVQNCLCVSPRQKGIVFEADMFTGLCQNCRVETPYCISNGAAGYLSDLWLSTSDNSPYEETRMLFVNCTHVGKATLSFKCDEVHDCAFINCKGFIHAIADYYPIFSNTVAGRETVQSLNVANRGKHALVQNCYFSHAVFLCSAESVRFVGNKIHQRAIGNVRDGAGNLTGEPQPCEYAISIQGSLVDYSVDRGGDHWVKNLIVRDNLVKGWDVMAIKVNKHGNVPEGINGTHRWEFSNNSFIGPLGAQGFTAGTDINETDNTITFVDHNFWTHDEVVYRSNRSGATGLVDGQKYIVVRVDTHRIALAQDHQAADEAERRVLDADLPSAISEFVDLTSASGKPALEGFAGTWFPAGSTSTNIIRSEGGNTDNYPRSTDVLTWHNNNVVNPKGGAIYCYPADWVELLSNDTGDSHTFYLPTKFFGSRSDLISPNVNPAKGDRIVRRDNGTSLWYDGSQWVPIGGGSGGAWGWPYNLSTGALAQGTMSFVNDGSGNVILVALNNLDINGVDHSDEFGTIGYGDEIYIADEQGGWLELKIKSAYVKAGRTLHDAEEAGGPGVTLGNKCYVVGINNAKSVRQLIYISQLGTSLRGTDFRRKAIYKGLAGLWEAADANSDRTLANGVVGFFSDSPVTWTDADAVQVVLSGEMWFSGAPNDDYVRYLDPANPGGIVVNAPSGAGQYVQAVWRPLAADVVHVLCGQGVPADLSAQAPDELPWGWRFKRVSGGGSNQGDWYTSSASGLEFVTFNRLDLDGVDLQEELGRLGPGDKLWLGDIAGNWESYDVLYAYMKDVRAIVVTENKQSSGTDISLNAESSVRVIRGADSVVMKSVYYGGTHPFAAGDAVYQDAAGTWHKAIATDRQTLAQGIVTGTEPNYTDTFSVAYRGLVHLPAHGKIESQWLSPTTAGAVGAEPTTGGQFSQVVYRPVGPDWVLVECGQGQEVKEDFVLPDTLRPGWQFTKGDAVNNAGEFTRTTDVGSTVVLTFNRLDGVGVDVLNQLASLGVQDRIYLEDNDGGWEWYDVLSAYQKGDRAVVAVSGGTGPGVADGVPAVLKVLQGGNAYSHINVAQTAHGFTELDAVYQDAAGVWKKAIASDDDTLAQGIVWFGEEVSQHPNDFTVVYRGLVKTRLGNAGHGIAGPQYLSANTAGARTATPPTADGQYQQLLYRPVGTDYIYVECNVVDRVVPQAAISQKTTGWRYQRGSSSIQGQWYRGAGADPTAVVAISINESDLDGVRLLEQIVGLTAGDLIWLEDDQHVAEWYTIREVYSKQDTGGNERAILKVKDGGGTFVGTGQGVIRVFKGSGRNIKTVVRQPGHNFLARQAVYQDSAGTWRLAIASGAETLAQGIVGDQERTAIDPDWFTVIHRGFAEFSTRGSHNYTSPQWLSDTTAGSVGAAPTTSGHYRQLICRPVSATAVFVECGAGDLIQDPPQTPQDGAPVDAKYLLLPGPVDPALQNAVTIDSLPGQSIPLVGGDPAQATRIFLGRQHDGLYDEVTIGVPHDKTSLLNGGELVGTTSPQTLTNKIINGSQLVDKTVSLSKLPDIGADTLLGAEVAGSPTEISIGANLEITGNTLSALTSSGLETSWRFTVAGSVTTSGQIWWNPTNSHLEVSGTDGRGINIIKQLVSIGSTDAVRLTAEDGTVVYEFESRFSHCFAAGSAAERVIVKPNPNSILGSMPAVGETVYLNVSWKKSSVVQVVDYSHIDGTPQAYKPYYLDPTSKTWKLASSGSYSTLAQAILQAFPQPPYAVMTMRGMMFYGAVAHQKGRKSYLSASAGGALTIRPSSEGDIVQSLYVETDDDFMMDVQLDVEGEIPSSVAGGGAEENAGYLLFAPDMGGAGTDPANARVISSLSPSPTSTYAFGNDGTGSVRFLFGKSSPYVDTFQIGVPLTSTRTVGGGNLVDTITTQSLENKTVNNVLLRTDAPGYYLDGDGSYKNLPSSAIKYEPGWSYTFRLGTSNPQPGEIYWDGSSDDIKVNINRAALNNSNVFNIRDQLLAVSPLDVVRVVSEDLSFEFEAVLSYSTYLNPSSLTQNVVLRIYDNQQQQKGTLQDGQRVFVQIIRNNTSNLIVVNQNFSAGNQYKPHYFNGTTWELADNTDHNRTAQGVLRPYPNAGYGVIVTKGLMYYGNAAQPPIQYLSTAGSLTPTRPTAEGALVQRILSGTNHDFLANVELDNEGPVPGTGGSSTGGMPLGTPIWVHGTVDPSVTNARSFSTVGELSTQLAGSSNVITTNSNSQRLSNKQISGTQIDDGTLALRKLSSVNPSRIIGRYTGVAGPPVELAAERGLSIDGDGVGLADIGTSKLYGTSDTSSSPTAISVGTGLRISGSTLESTGGSSASGGMKNFGGSIAKHPQLADSFITIGETFMRLTGSVGWIQYFSGTGVSFNQANCEISLAIPESTATNRMVNIAVNFSAYANYADYFYVVLLRNGSPLDHYLSAMDTVEQSLRFNFSANWFVTANSNNERYSFALRVDPAGTSLQMNIISGVFSVSGTYEY